MTLMVNGKKVLGYAIGGNEYLSGGSLNAFYIDKTPYERAVFLRNIQFHTIDMTKYFKEADTKHPDVQYYQIMLALDYEDNDYNTHWVRLITPLLKRGEINNKRSAAIDNDQAVTAWFTDKNTLAISTESMYDKGLYRPTWWQAYVYGFTSQDVGSVA